MSSRDEESAKLDEAFRRGLISPAEFAERKAQVLRDPHPLGNNKVDSEVGCLVALVPAAAILLKILFKYVLGPD